jgi:histidyl-tRNA synthetase
MDTYLQVSQQLRSAGINVLTGFEERSLGKQFQQADKLGIPMCVVIGPDELAAGQATLKILKTGEQIKVALAAVVDAVQQQMQYLKS